MNGTVSNIVLGLNQSNTTVDAGFIQAVLALGNRVWYDTNNDGLNGSSENGIANVTVNLYADANNDNVADGSAIATRTTDASGYYSFTALAPGNYIVGAVLPAGYVSSNVNGGDPDNNINLDDNGQVLVGNEIRGLAITLAAGTEKDDNSSKSNTNTTYDFGMLPDCNCINTSGNLLTNGSFESGTTGWTASGGSISTGTGYVACGSKNGFNSTATSGKISTVYQDVTVTAGTKLTFTGFAGIHAGGLSCSPKQSLIFRNA
ncbi:MAG TPA: SdrD B-like domain-containing protein, partial [Ferruginibacter sp.]|nr:SdrD B-like domain-containing protein [Ferruginibacter sp.]